MKIPKCWEIRKSVFFFQMLATIINVIYYSNVSWAHAYIPGIVHFREGNSSFLVLRGVRAQLCPVDSICGENLEAPCPESVFNSRRLILGLSF